jgi:hypothetical protein
LKNVFQIPKFQSQFQRFFANKRAHTPCATPWIQSCSWYKKANLHFPLLCLQPWSYTPLAVVSRTRKTLRVSTTAGIAQIPAVSSKEGAVIGAVLGTRKFHRGDIRHIWIIAE